MKESQSQRLEELLRAAAAQVVSTAQLLELLISKGTSDGERSRSLFAYLARLESPDRLVVEATVTADFDAGLAREFLSPGMSVSLKATPLAVVEQTGATCYWADLVSEPNLPGSDRFRSLGVHSLISATFRVSGTRYFLSLASRRTADFDEADRQYLEIITTILEKHLLQEWQAKRITYNTAHDSLTGLVNRQSFRSALRAALQIHDACAVAVFDIAGFREVNERVGDMVGDALLVEVAAFLAGTMHFEQSASRLSGDRFGVSLPGIGTREAAVAALAPMLARFDRPFATGDRTGTEGIQLAVRIGVALMPSDGSGADELLVRSQTALVASKAGRPGRISFYEPSLEAALLRPPTPDNESERLSALARFEILDTSPEPAFDRITRLAAKLLHTPMARITFVDAHRQWFKSELGVAVGETPRDEAFCAYVVNEQDTFVVHDASTDPRFRFNPAVTGEPNVRFYAGAPLVTADGLSIGAMCVMDDKPRADLSEEDEETLRDLADLVMSELGTRRAIGYLDSTTQLPNQARLREDLDAFINDAGRKDESLAVVAVDMAQPHRFDELVRTFGPNYSEKFILASGQLLRSTLDASIRIFNLGSYHFAIVISGTVLSNIDSFLEQLGESLAHPLQCGDIKVATSAVLGAAHFPADGGTGEELIRAAISAMHGARSEGHSWGRYSDANDRGYRRSFRLLGDMPHGLERTSQFAMVYQPKIDLLSGRCIGAEALARWNHPEFGSVPPYEFVTLAERSGVIRPLTDWIVSATLSQISAWRSAGLSCKIAINVSMLDLDDDTFAGRLVTSLAKYDVPESAIELEVTESAGVQEASIAIRQMRELQHLGIDIAIDDFGTGQSAHGYLKSIPATMVKIDQSFIRAVPTVARDQMIVASMIELAHGFGYRVVAEGIETEAVCDWLTANDCDIGQGYLFARPLAAAQFTNWFAEHSARPIRGLQQR